MARELKTGWVCLATSGPVVDGKEDGRVIEKAWLEDMAEVYNAKIHTARIWPEHRRYFSGGKVLALKIEPATDPELKGEIQLFGILAPNDWLMRANAEGDFTHPSLEVGENFRGTGKFFLRGLGVTDDPASAGVTELKFSSHGNEEKALVFSGKQFDLSESIEKPTSLSKRIFSAIAGSDSQPDQDDDTMTKEQLEALTESLTGLIDKKFTALRDELKTPPAATGEGEGEGDDAPVDSKAFKALQEENADLKGRLDSLETEFKALKNTPAGDGTETEEGTGDGKKPVI